MPDGLCHWLLRCHRRRHVDRACTGPDLDDVQKPNSSASLTKVHLLLPPDVRPPAAGANAELSVGHDFSDSEPLSDTWAHWAPSVLKRAAVCSHRKRHMLQAWIRFSSSRATASTTAPGLRSASSTGKWCRANHVSPGNPPDMKEG